MKFDAQHDLKGIAPRSITGQLTALATSMQYKVSAVGMLPSGASEVFLMQTTGVRTPIVTQVVAHPSGRINFETPLAKGQSATVEAFKAEYCAFVGGIKPGKVGEQAAAAGIASNPANALTVISPLKLSEQAGKVASMAMSGAANYSMKDFLIKGRTGEIDRTRAGAAFRPVYVSYLNRRYQLDGKAYVVSHSTNMQVDFLVAPVKGLLRVQQNQGHGGDFRIKCNFPNDQRDFFQTLQEGSFLKVEGVVDTIDEGSMTLRDCRQVN